MRRPISLRLFRLRFWRKLRRSQRQFENLSQEAEQNLEKLFFKRFGRLKPVRRFVISWVALIALLIAAVMVQNLLLSGYFQTLQPVAGGIYNEGVLGNFRGANPLYATSDIDVSVSRLVFSGLFTHNDQNQFVGDLASSYSVDARGLIYTVHLKPHLSWHDGQPLTSADVAFTYNVIENPDASSPLRSSWQGITVTAPDARTVTFKLPSPLASFAYNLTNGIVPQHVLKDIPLANLRSADFNTVHPIGSGPFMWQGIDVTGTDPSNAEEQISLLPFTNYSGGQPKLQEFIVHAYADEQKLIKAFRGGQLAGIEGLSSIPKNLTKQQGVYTHNLLFSAGVYVFFKTSVGVLADQKVRQSLVQAANAPDIISHLGYATPAVREPVLKSQFAYNPAYAQASFSLSSADSILSGDGWLMDKDGYRHRDKATLSFSLTAPDTGEYKQVTERLRQQWQKLGVRVDVRLQNNDDFHNSLTYHDYDAVLYGVSLGLDPDVFVYWHSSQADIRSANRLNLSEYKNAAADAALEAGRTRLDPTLRSVKYRPFLQAWQQDAPALGLYQPRLLYLTNGSVAGLNDHVINAATDRYSNVQNWQIREARVTN